MKRAMDFVHVKTYIIVRLPRYSCLMMCRPTGPRMSWRAYVGGDLESMTRVTGAPHRSPVRIYPRSVDRHLHMSCSIYKYHILGL